MNRNYLSPEERAEFDLLMYEAGYDPTGKPRKSNEIASRVIEMLREAADQAHRPWAQLVLDDMLTIGARARWRAWNREREPVTVRGESYVVSKPAAMGIRKRDDDRRTYYQLTFWQDMTRDELSQIIDGSSKRIASERVSIATARRLLKLLDQVPEAETALQAAQALQVDLERYLGTAESDEGEAAA